MTAIKADIISRLQKEILPLQGLRPVLNNKRLDTGMGMIMHAFSGATFPVGAIHEFISKGSEARAATCGFVSGILDSLMKNNGAVIWISATRMIFPPALAAFGIPPDRVIFIDVKKEKDIQWIVEEALKCEGLSAVIGEMRELSFKASRRLQLAVEKSRVTGFILRNDPREINITACISRWEITSLPGELLHGMPGVGFPRWNVALLKIRNGKPASWQVEFSKGMFRPLTNAPVIHHQQRKAV